MVYKYFQCIYNIATILARIGLNLIYDISNLQTMLEALREWPRLVIRKISYPKEVKPGGEIKIIVRVKNAGASGGVFVQAFNITQNIKCGGTNRYMKSGDTKECELYPHCYARNKEGTEKIRIDAGHIESGGKRVVDDSDIITVTVTEKPKPPVKLILIDLDYPEEVNVGDTFTVTFTVKNVGDAGKAVIDIKPGPRYVFGYISPDQVITKSNKYKAEEEGYINFTLHAYTEDYTHFKETFKVHVVTPGKPPTPPPPPECKEGETKCIGFDLYECKEGKWQLVKKNAEECGYKPPTPPAPPVTPPPPECKEGETKCEGYDLYACIDGKWQLVKKNAEECGYKPTPRPVPPTPTVKIPVPIVITMFAVAGIVIYVLMKRS